MVLSQITALKQKLDSYRPFSQAILDNLSRWFEVELTYSSNAIEGNTLTRQETALVLEKGITVGGKSLKDHLEATNHKEALDYIKMLVSQKTFTLEAILKIHHLILKGIDNTNAGTLRTVPVRISGSAVVLPNYKKVPQLLDQLLKDLQNDARNAPQKAFYFHYQFVTIHPFVDGNGRTARLLMNLLLMQEGYPPIFILPKERLAYIKSLEKAQLGGRLDDYESLMENALIRSLQIYLKAFQNKPEKAASQELIKIGELSKQTGEAPSTLRYWIKIGLLEVENTTPSGYQLFNVDQIARAKKIRALQKERYTLEEIAKSV